MATKRITKKRKTRIKNLWTSIGRKSSGEFKNLVPLARFKYKTVRKNKVCYYRTKRDWALDKPAKVFAK